MGQRYEKSKKNVSDNKQTLERLHGDKDTLHNEYAPLSLLDSIQGMLDDEATDAIQGVRIVGELESQRIESETSTAENEKSQIVGDIDSEIAKLNAGLEKLHRSGNIEFGKAAVEQSSQEYKKQIDKFKALKNELLSVVSGSDSAAVEHIIQNNSELIETLSKESANEYGSNEHSAFAELEHFYSEPAKQTEHRPIISSHEGAINAVMEDVRLGSGKDISREQAEMLLSGVRVFSGEEYSLVRKAYNNPNAPQSDIAALNAIDTYINSAPKWEGEVFRGINVSRSTADRILSDQTVDMLGPSSWSSELNVAERFSIMGSEPVRMIFVLPENKSGASITHLATYNGAESEVTAPSGVLYSIDRYEKARTDNRDYIYVYVHE